MPTTERRHIKAKTVKFRATGFEVEAWERAAKAENLTVSDWIRRRLNRHDTLTVEAEILSKILVEMQRNNRLLSNFITITDT